MISESSLEASHERIDSIKDDVTAKIDSVTVGCCKGRIKAYYGRWSKLSNICDEDQTWTRIFVI